MKPFTQQEIIAQKGDIIYMYPDGYADQFGGSKGKKFMSKPYDPDGCQNWIMDDGLEGYSSPRYDPASGLPVCNDK